MQRTSIMLPPALKTRALRQAQDLGISLGELIRRSLVLVIRQRPAARGRSDDPLFADTAVFQGSAPRDLARHHDRYLYGAAQS